MKPIKRLTDAEAAGARHSVSQSETHHRCPRLWAYRYLLDLKPADQSSLVLGNAVHDALESRLMGKDLNTSINDGITYLRQNNGDAVCPGGEQMLTGMLRGYEQHGLPQFLTVWEVVKCEAAFDYFVAPGFQVRGFIDVVARRRTDGQIGLFDHKTCGDDYATVLTEKLSYSQQLAEYCIAWREQVQHSIWPGSELAWPAVVGYNFLKKPRKGGDPTSKSLFQMKEYLTGPVFHQFCLEAKANMIREMAQRRIWRQLFAQDPKGAMESIPCNYGGCHAFGRLCDYAHGCHTGAPLHRQMTYA